MVSLPPPPRPVDSSVVFDLQKMETPGRFRTALESIPIAIENNPDGSGRRNLLKPWLIERLLGGRFCPAQGSGENQGSRHADVRRRRGCSRVRHRDLPGPEDTLGQQSAVECVFAYSLPDIKLLDMSSLPEQPVPGKPLGPEIRPGSHSLPTARPFMFHLRGKDGDRGSMCRR